MDSRVVIWILIIGLVRAQYEANGRAAEKTTTYGPLLRVEGEVHAEKAEEQKLGGLNPTDVYGEAPVQRPLPSSVGSVAPSPKSPKVVDSSEESKESVTEASASAPGYGPEASSTTEKHDLEEHGLFSTGIHGMDITTIESPQETTAGNTAIAGASNAGGAAVSSEHNSGYDVQAQNLDTTTNTAAPTTTTTSELEKSAETQESTRKTATTPPPTPKPEENTTKEPKSPAVATPEVNPKSEETTTAATNATAETVNPEEFKLSAEQASSKSAEAVQDALKIISTTETAVASNGSESNSKPAAENQASAGNGGYDSPVPATRAAFETTPAETTASLAPSAAPEAETTVSAASETSETSTTASSPEPVHETTGTPSAAEYDFGSSPAPPQGTPEASSREVNTLPPAAEPAAPGFSTPSSASYGDDVPANTVSPATEISTAASTEAETTVETTVTTIESSEAPKVEVTQASPEGTKIPESGYDSASSSSPASADTSLAAEPTTTSEPAEITEAQTTTLSAGSAEATATLGSSETTESSNPSTESVSSDSNSATTKEEDAGAAPGLNPASSTSSAPGYDAPAVSSPASVAPTVIGEPSTPTEEKENPTTSYEIDSKPSEAPAPTNEAPSVTPAASNGYEQSPAGSANSQPASPASSHSASRAGSGASQGESGYQSNHPESVSESHASFGSHPEPAPASESPSPAAPAEPSPATTESPKRWKISQGFKKPVDGQTGAKSYDDPNRVTEPVHFLEPSGYGVNGQSPVYSASTRVISQNEAVGYDGVPTGAQRDTKIEKATARVDVHPRHSSMKRKWKPFEMNCASEVDDRGTELCSEWAKGGLCEAHKATMFLFCRKTCLCVGPPSSAENLEIRRGRRHPRFFRFQL